MNKTWILCFVVLFISMSFLPQGSCNEKSSSASSGSSSSSGSSTNSSAVGLAPVSATLYLLIPAATLGFIHGRS